MDLARAMFVIGPSGLNGALAAISTLTGHIGRDAVGLPLYVGDLAISERRRKSDAVCVDQRFCEADRNRLRVASGRTARTG